MFQIFRSAPLKKPQETTDFYYLQPGECYLDSACQTLRPRDVIEAERAYYEEYNACGGRVKYKWGQKVDGIVADAREELLRLMGKSSKDYTVVFTLNTTYGINMLLHQVETSLYDAIITSDIEHNSVFLPTISWAKKNNKKRYVLERDPDGTLPIEILPTGPSILLVNTVSNIDGRVLKNAKALADNIHKQKGLVFFDCAQMFSVHEALLKNVDFDAAFASGHKMYGPSIGFMVVKNELLEKIDPYFIGGGTVQDVAENSYVLMNDAKERYAVLEPGLQNWAGIAGLLEAIRWKKKFVPETSLQELSKVLFDGLKTIQNIQILNDGPTPTISFYVDGVDSHQLALYLAEQNIMCRSGYFCCHYYLKNKKKSPPLLRISLGLHSTRHDVDHLLQTLHLILKNI